MPDIQHPTTSCIYCLDLTGPPRELVVVECFRSLDVPAVHGHYRLPVNASAGVYLAGAGWGVDRPWQPRSWGRATRAWPIDGPDAVYRRAAEQALKRRRDDDDDLGGRRG